MRCGEARCNGVWCGLAVALCYGNVCWVLFWSGMAGAVRSGRCGLAWCGEVRFGRYGEVWLVGLRLRFGRVRYGSSGLVWSGLAAFGAIWRGKVRHLNLILY